MPFDSGKRAIFTMNFLQAIADYTKVISMNPRFTSAYYNRAVAYDCQGMVEEAVDDYRKAIQHRHYNRGKQLEQGGDLQKAKKNYTKALQLDPSDKECERCLESINAKIEKNKTTTEGSTMNTESLVLPALGL